MSVTSVKGLKLFSIRTVIRFIIRINGPYPQLCHKIKTAAVFRGLCTESLYGEVIISLIIRNPKIFQVRHIAIQSFNANARFA